MAPRWIRLLGCRVGGVGVTFFLASPLLCRALSNTIARGLLSPGTAMASGMRRSGRRTTWWTRRQDTPFRYGKFWHYENLIRFIGSRSSEHCIALHCIRCTPTGGRRSWCRWTTRGCGTCGRRCGTGSTSGSSSTSGCGRRSRASPTSTPSPPTPSSAGRPPPSHTDTTTFSSHTTACSIRPTK